MINLKPKTRAPKGLNPVMAVIKKMTDAIKAKRQARAHARNERRFNQAVKVLNEFGLAPVRLVTRAGTDYIIGADGLYHKIGRGEKKK